MRAFSVSLHVNGLRSTRLKKKRQLCMLMKETWKVRGDRKPILAPRLEATWNILAQRPPVRFHAGCVSGFVCVCVKRWLAWYPFFTRKDP